MHDINQLQKEMDALRGHFKEDIASIRGARPTTALVEDIGVECYGQHMSIKQLGSITIVPPREIQISVWDGGVVKAIEKTVSEKLSVQASSDGNTIHINLPQLTQERRDEIIKLLKNKAEEVRIKSRTLRDSAKKEIESLEKQSELTEDDRVDFLERIQKAMDSFNEEIKQILDKKIEEINE